MQYDINQVLKNWTVFSFNGMKKAFRFCHMLKLCISCGITCVVPGPKSSGVDHAVIYVTQPKIDIPSEVTPEERHIQGHHSMPQSSMRRYSRDYVFLQLKLQRTIRSKKAQKPLQELPVQVERFRKQSPPHEWQKFSFNAHPIPDESLSAPPIISSEVTSVSSSSSSSSSESSDSDASPNPKRKAATKQLYNDRGGCEEIFVAWPNRIQHAIKRDVSSHKNAICFEGVAFRSVCGSYLIIPDLSLPAMPSAKWHFSNEQLARKRGPCSSDMNALRISG